MDSSKDKVLVCIPTFSRPQQLTSLLDSIYKSTFKGKFEVLVIENDAEYCEGKNIVRDQFPNCEVLVEKKQGLAHARNRIIKTFLARPIYTWIMMCDDDQTVDPKWLSNALETAQEYNADLVGSSVHSIFSPSAPEWVKYASIFRRDVTTHGRVPILQGTGGVLIKRAALERIQAPWFDNCFNASGGEDIDFFLKLKKSGAIFAKSHTSIVWEHYSDDRLTLRWALRRSFRTGITDTRAKITHTNNKTVIYIRLFYLALFMITKGFLNIPVKLSQQNLGVDAMCQIMRGIGMLGGLFFHKLPDDYANNR